MTRRETEFCFFGPRGIVVGCSSSWLGEELLPEGIADGITCVDHSPVARACLTAQDTHGVEAVVANILDLPFEHESFDLVIEKGTMAVVCGKCQIAGLWKSNCMTVDNPTTLIYNVDYALAGGYRGMETRRSSAHFGGQPYVSDQGRPFGRPVHRQPTAAQHADARTCERCSVAHTVAALLKSKT
ncbi:hypothetical protein EJB05_35231, partial [Eragrostis curvula]